MDGKPRDIFKHKEVLMELQLDIPAVSQIAEMVHKQIPTFSKHLIQEEELINEVKRVSKARSGEVV
jgi:hypothetical protein